MQDGVLKVLWLCRNDDGAALSFAAAKPLSTLCT